MILDMIYCKQVTIWKRISVRNQVRTQTVPDCCQNISFLNIWATVWYSRITPCYRITSSEEAFMQSANELLHIAQYLYTLLATGFGDSSEGIATGCGLDYSGFESRRGRDFTHPSRLAWSQSRVQTNSTSIPKPPLWSFIAYLKVKLFF
jgi:hypothetical protein